MLSINSQAGNTGSTSARGIIPEPIEFPPTPEGRGRKTKNSSRGRQSVDPSLAITIADTQGVHPALPGYSGNSSSPAPEVTPVSDSASVSNSHPSQNTNPVPFIPVQIPVVPNPVPNPVMSTTPNPVASTIDHSKLPFGFGKNSLKFNDSEEIEELPAFFENVESIAARVGATSAEDIKWIALHYCESQTKEHWRALASANDPFTWEEFKTEVKASYPELKEIERGSLKTLQKLVAKTAAKKLRNNDTAGLQQYHRNFRATVQKLLKGSTPRVVNRELVSLYLLGLPELFRQEVKSIMRTTSRESLGSYKRASAAWAAANPGVAYVAPERDETDLFDWTDLLDAATRITEEESLNIFRLDSYTVADAKKGSVVLLQEDSSAGGSGDVKALAAKLEKLEAETQKQQRKMVEDKLAYEKEISNQLASTFATHLDKFTSDQHRELQQIKAAVEGSRADNPVRQSSGASYSAPNFVRNRTPGNMPCYYCYEPGHFILECAHLKEDVNKGKVRMDGSNRARLYDGKTIPREPMNKSPKEKAHEYFDRRVVVTQNYDEIMDQFFGEEGEEGGPTNWERRPTSPPAPNEDALGQVLAAIQGLGTRSYETRSKGPSASNSGF